MFHVDPGSCLRSPQLGVEDGPSINHGLVLVGVPAKTMTSEGRSGVSSLILAQCRAAAHARVNAQALPSMVGNHQLLSPCPYGG